MKRGLEILGVALVDVDTHDATAIRAVQTIKGSRSQENRPDTHLATYAENVYVGGRKALTEGKFHDMFLAGNGHELEDYTDENGKLHVAHAQSLHLHGWALGQRVFGQTSKYSVLLSSTCLAAARLFRLRSFLTCPICERCSCRRRIGIDYHLC